MLHRIICNTALIGIEHEALKRLNPKVKWSPIFFTRLMYVQAGEMVMLQCSTWEGLPIASSQRVDH